MGTGITKIKDLCIANNTLVPDFVFDEFFTVIFKRKVTNGGLNGGLNGELNAKQIILLENIRKKEGINVTELSKILDIPFSTLDKQIRVLLKQNLIIRKGSKKTGGYYIV